MKKIVLILLFSLCIFNLFAQQDFHIKGRVINQRTRQPIEYANVLILGTSKGTTTDSNGEFLLNKLKPGTYQLKVSLLGFTPTVTPQYIISNNSLFVNVELKESAFALKGVTINASPFKNAITDPAGLQAIGLEEIEKSPGANRDISRILQSYPGVSFSPANYRNDLLVRGGGPGENSYYIDEVEVPNINHFTTQGASGGAVGLINADLIREVDFYSAGFPVNKGNALSSVIQISLRDGNMEENNLKVTLGASEVALSSSGHLDKKTSYTFSIRRSYLQFLFDLLDLPFLPTFTDAQFKIKRQFNPYHQLSIVGIGGIDDMKLNENAHTDENRYILSYLPKIKQRTFTLGAVYKHYQNVNVQTIVLSQSFLNNKNNKYRNNDESSPENLILDLDATEQESKLRLENKSTFQNWKFNIGANFGYTQYKNKTFQKVYTDKPNTYDYLTYLDIFSYGAFASISYLSDNERVYTLLGVRSDANNFSDNTKDLSNQLSPRMVLSYKLNDELKFKANAGIYYQMPPYTALGFKLKTGQLANKYLKFMKTGQISAGVDWITEDNYELSGQLFYKSYEQMPLSVEDGIPLACKGAIYGTLGDEQLISTAEGQSYGLELLFKWTVPKRLNFLSSFTLFRSEYKANDDGNYIASAWDNRYLANIKGTYFMNHNWSIGLKVSSIGGAPYTPYDEEKSSLVTAWDAQGKPYYDYSKYNSERLSSYTQVDVRVDKLFFFKKVMLGLYLDLQNITNSKFKQPDVLMSTGDIVNPDAPLSEQRYKMKKIKQSSGSIIPTLGVVFEY